MKDLFLEMESVSFLHVEMEELMMEKNVMEVKDVKIVYVEKNIVLI